MTSTTFRASRLLRPRRRFFHDKGGAAIVEFAMACMPVFCLFFGMMQWCIMAYVNLIVRHAAFVAVRCDAVVHPGMPDAGHENDCSEKAMDALFKHVHGYDHQRLTVKFDNPAATDQTLDTADVTFDYKCTIPLGNVIACGASRELKLKATASFPNQGSTYQKIWIHS
jgi:hypothetical protein